MFCLIIICRVAELENALRAQGSTMAGKKKMTGVKFPVSKPSLLFQNL